MVFPPWHHHATSDRGSLLLLLLFVDVVKELLDVNLFLLVVRVESLQRVNPLLLHELVIAGELPCNGLLLIFRREIELLKGHRFPDVLHLHHVPGFELDGKVVGTTLKPIDFFDIQYLY